MAPKPGRRSDRQPELFSEDQHQSAAPSVSAVTFADATPSSHFDRKQPATPAEEAASFRVIRSPNRRTTVSARMVDGVMELRIPQRLSKKEEAHWVKEMLARFSRKQVSDQIDLSARAAALSTRLQLPKPTSIRWVSNQGQRWGSCTPADRSIRISDRLNGVPLWVLDYVLVHEMAHLVHADHGRRFWTLVARYPRTERARGYLMALGIGETD